MKTTKKIKSLIPLLALMIVFIQCSEDDEPGILINPDASSINELMGQFPDWVDQTIPMEWDSLVDPVDLQNEDKIPVNCEKYNRGISISSEDIVAVGTNFGKIWPGAIIEGNSLESGDLKLINIDRAGITINTNLPINQTFREIDDPNSVTVQQAISEMQIESGTMPDGVQAGAGQMETRVEEYSTYLQAMLSMGINGGFAEPQSKIKLSADGSFGVEREQNTHSVVVKFVQKTFTVRIADDLIDSPSDFFASTVTLNDVKKLESDGAMSANNVPLYIESVTYGRFLLFSLTSSTVSTAAKLNAAVEASWDQYANAGGELSAEFELALSSKTTKIFSAGGSEAGANAAVANLDWSEYFVEAPVTTTVPVSFVARTLNGEKKVVLIDNAVYDQRGECVSPENIKIKVTLDNVTISNPIVGVRPYGSSSGKLPGQQILDVLETGDFVTTLKLDLTKKTDKIKIGGKGSQEYLWKIEDADTEIDKLLIRSLNNFQPRNDIFEFPFKELNEGVQNRTYDVTNNFGEKMKFFYKITKTFE